MNFFARADERIINVVEPFAWRIEYRFGYNCFDLARASMTLSALCFNASWGLTHPILLQVFGPLSGLAWLTFMAGIIPMEHAVITRPHHLNPVKQHWYMRFIACALMVYAVYGGLFVIPMISSVFEILGGVCGVICFYLASCNVMPAHWEPPQREEVAAGALQGA